MTILQWIKPWLLRLASAATVHWAVIRGIFFLSLLSIPEPNQLFFTLPADLSLYFCPHDLVSCSLSNLSLIQLYTPI